MNNDYGIYDDIILCFKGILKDQDFEFLHKKLEHVANDQNAFQIQLGLKSIADCQNNVENYIRACSFNNNICAYDHLDIAKRFIKHQRPKEALQWLDNMEIFNSHPWQHDKKYLRIQALELDKNHEQSYHRFMCENLFDHVNIDLANVNVPNGLGDAQANCDDYNKKLLENEIDIVSSFGQPVHYMYIDLMNDEVIEFDDYETALEQVEALNPSYDEVDADDFEEWMNDGNVEEIEPNVYATQDAQWKNRIKGIDALRKYYNKEFK
jgi:hypothetical protein